MIQIEKTTNTIIIKSIITNPVIWDMAGFVGNPTKYIPNLESTWLIIKDKDILGLYEIRQSFSKIIAEVHIYLLPEFHKTGKSLEAANAVRDWAKKNTFYIKALTCIPETSEKAIKYVTKVGWKICGEIVDGIIYKNQLQNLILFDLNI